MPSVQTYAGLAANVLNRPARFGSARLVAIDGPVGAGKSRFAERLSAAVGGVSVLHTDSFASWQNPLDWWQLLEEKALAPLSQGRQARFRGSDWTSGQRGDWLEVGPSQVVILEGVSESRSAVAERLSLAIWIETPRDARLERGMQRDGEQMRGQWLEWMAEEDRHFARDQPHERADVVVDGAPSLAHDPDTEFVTLP